MESASDRVVELESSLKKTFYPGLLLLDYLRKARPFRKSTVTNQPPSESFFDQQHDFKVFLNKLSLLLQTNPHGDSVSACVILQLMEGGVKFVFASNQRTDKQLSDLKAEITSLCAWSGDSLGREAGPEALQTLRGQILHRALKLNATRIKSYLTSLEDNLKRCIATCQTDGGADCEFENAAVPIGRGSC